MADDDTYPIHPEVEKISGVIPAVDGDAEEDYWEWVLEKHSRIDAEDELVSPQVSAL